MKKIGEFLRIWGAIAGVVIIIVQLTYYFATGGTKIKEHTGLLKVASAAIEVNEEKNVEQDVCLKGIEKDIEYIKVGIDDIKAKL